MRRIVACLVLLVATTAIAPAGAAAPGTYRDGDLSLIARNILPPGQGQYLNAAELAAAQALGIQPDHNTDQLAMYENLVREAGSVDQADLATLFKDASFGVAPGDAGRTYAPRAGVTVIRDLSYNVPHVYGTTRADTMFGAGYVSAEDRFFMMDVLRHLARGRLSELLGGSDANLAADAGQRLVADYTEEELAAMATRVRGLDPVLGPLAELDVNSFAEGVNAWLLEAIVDQTKLPAEYAALQIVPKPWKVEDSVALATLIGGQFSVGGGGQLGNAAFLSALEDSVGASARAVFDDLRNANDPEAPVATHEPFPFNEPLAPVDPDAVARPDRPAAVAAAAARAGLPEQVDGPLGPIRLAAGSASNALLVAPSHSADGRPITVFGPQVGYYSPEILMEIDLHGPGVHARGAAFPGISMYALLGRGTGYGWSATTAIGDHVDVRAVKLCHPTLDPVPADSTYYLRDGECRAMHRRTDSWLAKPGAGGAPSSPDAGKVLVEMTTERVQLGDPDGPQQGALPIGPDWAIVLARGTVAGAPAAFVRQRATYGIELDQTLAFVEIHDPSRIGSVADMQRAFGRWFNFSFNWHLIDANGVGFYTTGRYPVLAAGVDADLPFWGDSAWDWDRFLTYAEHPQANNPAQGYIMNWNNKQAPGFRAPDNWWAYGSVGRMQLLEEGVQAELTADGDVSIPELVDVMGVAATRDLRGVTALPHLLDIIGTPEDDELAQVADVLQRWVNDGAHRRDADLDGSYEHAEAVALMDALWEPLLRHIFEPRLGRTAFEAMPMLHDDAAGAGGSAYLEGWYGQVEKDLRQVLGAPVAAPTSQTYCGGGVLANCRAELLNALADAHATVGVPQADLGARLRIKDSIVFSPVGVQEQRLMHWQNRPTFQQVLEFGTP